MTAATAGIHYLEPGVEGIVQTSENQVFYGDNRYWNFWKLQQALIAGVSRDSANPDDATILRAGLLMAFNQVTNKWQPYDGVGAGNTGLQEVSGILYASINTQKDGSDQDRYLNAIAVGGFWRAEGVFLLGESGPGFNGPIQAAARVSIADLQVRLSDEQENRPTVA